MYRWYEEAPETLVYLADTQPSLEIGYLTKSRWMTRPYRNFLRQRASDSMIVGGNLI